MKRRAHIQEAKRVTMAIGREVFPKSLVEEGKRLELRGLLFSSDQERRRPPAWSDHLP